MGNQKILNGIKQYEKTPTNWGELYKAYNFFYEKKPQSKYKWIFRGENYSHNRPGNINKDFKSSLDKAFKRFDVAENRRKDIEKNLVREFQRKAQLYSEGKSVDLLEALALLRHYEGPARILDWGYSFFVNVYFAVARAKPNDNLAVWAINNDWLAERNKNFEIEIGKVDKAAEPCDKSSKSLEYLMENPKSFIYAVNPYHLNERLSIQQGVLLVQGDIKKSWGANLTGMIEKDEENKKSKYGTLLWKIDIKLKIEELRNVLKRLHHINISQATLFPDLGGFAQSLTNRIADTTSLGIEDTDR
ncbi:MAG: hypothetical protein A2Z59_09400 [Nitrospinae bacterium RIFCSPLOWO2_02_39_17]|nr:MAG: hypothetical protein A2Z59_09400 [Nitrospinae bacterium RIFCSPLOWO2_02_39_17]